MGGLWQKGLGGWFRRRIHSSSSQLSPFAVIASSVLYTWIYNNTRGSLLIVVLFHATTHLPYRYALVGGAVPPFLIYVTLTVMTAAGVAAAAGRVDLARRHRRLAGSPRHR
jgi:uncharacterized protein